MDHCVKVWKWKSLSPVWLFATPWTVVHGILQARILEWVAFHFSRGSSQPRDGTQVSCIAGEFFTSWAQGKPNGLLFSFKKEWSADPCHNMEVPWKLAAEWKKPATEASHCMPSWNVQSRYWFPEVWRKEGWGVTARESWVSSWGNKTVLENDAWTTLRTYQAAVNRALWGVTGAACESHCDKRGLNWREQVHRGVRLLPAAGRRTPGETISGRRRCLKCLKILRFIQLREPLELN